MSWETLRRDFRRTMARFSNTGLGGALRVLARWLRLHLPLPIRTRQRAARPERVVISLTTIPARARSLAPVLRSLLDQDMPADRIILWLPSRSLRQDRDYPDAGDVHIPEGVEVMRCEDLGPATKLLHSLRLEKDALVIAVDDDVVYPENLVSTLLSAHRKEPQTAFGLRGVMLEPGTRFVDLWHILSSGIDRAEPADILFGTWGYMVPAWLCDEAMHDFSGYPASVRWVDDVWISGHLARLGIARKVTPSDRFPLETLASLRHALTDGMNRSGENDEIAIKAFGDVWSKVRPPR
ncbi:MAG: glycosyltransferase family 2 protein [Hoeflea sp.]|uniref:glycosyltransferase family A protein n=1 Tax=Hoeflea sp. TaxID=1940281 RepID=UPI001DC3D412|nr:glycosyltransferase family A protein [Hoeflea sp.]MBU4530974.1 glycosyltransferase family 2 protein [Alphaproteobacteria bacterium]MBU4542749.1 glycosyltransferase family 2 protein [Alphaproteobacteria bacterium]MBU4552561.1 glycosyltransferase family 2 protein [Alphaproteobacteria bacterium]MBV1722866.1 glycosyltransferase family 2 protein [Hoeflea sp.]MBV1762777.1 glycosyltransferase family 2 protein [Hoeflea sp.]